jgi:hypothetical protein
VTPYQQLVALSLLSSGYTMGIVKSENGYAADGKPFRITWTKQSMLGGKRWHESAPVTKEFAECMVEFLREHIHMNVQPEETLDEMLAVLAEVP